MRMHKYLAKGTSDPGKGFTLVELLIVIVILGILVGLVMVMINPLRQKRRAREGVLIASMYKTCLALAACGSTTTDDTKCADFDLIGVTVPHVPTGAVYDVVHDADAKTVTVTGMLDACVYECSYNFSDQTSSSLSVGSQPEGADAVCITN